MRRAARAVCQRKKPPRDRRLKESRSEEEGTGRCADGSWCQLRGFSEEPKDSFVFVPRDGRKQARNNSLSQRQQMYN